MVKKLAVCSLIGLILAGLDVHAGNSQLEADTQALLTGHLYRDAIDRLSSVNEKSDDYGAALRLLGNIYRDGLGVPVDLDRSVAFYRDAVANGDSEAGYAIGLAYETGQGVPKSAASAFHWYESVADKDPTAALRTAEIILANESSPGFHGRDPIPYLRFAVERGLTRAQYVLAQLYLVGSHVDRNEEEGLSLLRLAAKSLPEAKSRLGMVLDTQGLYADAKLLFEDALPTGDAMAAAFLGHYAESGIEGPADADRALALYERAHGIAWAEEGYRRLTEQAQSIELLGFRAYGSTRRQIREHLKALGIKQVGGAEYFDAFDVSAALDRPNVALTTAYAPGAPEYLAEINYQFALDSSRHARDLLEEIEITLTQKYGAAADKQRSKGNYLWVWTKGQTRVELSHENSASAINVTYKMAPYVEALNRYVALKRQNEKGGIDNAL